MVEGLIVIEGLVGVVGGCDCCGGGEEEGGEEKFHYVIVRRVKEVAKFIDWRTFGGFGILV